MFLIKFNRTTHVFAFIFAFVFVCLFVLALAFFAILLLVRLWFCLVTDVMGVYHKYLAYTMKLARRVPDDLTLPCK